MTISNFINSPVDYDKTYSVIYTQDNFELRSYDSILTAEYDNELNNEFSVLADFIFGGNNQNRQIPMTAPVITTMEVESTMSFVMPKSITKDVCPKPNNSLVKLTTHAPRIAASISFPGFPEKETCESKKTELIEFLDNNKIDHIYDFELHVYDPPYKTFNRKNEIVVTLKQQS